MEKGGLAQTSQGKQQQPHVESLCLTCAISRQAAAAKWKGTDRHEDTTYRASRAVRTAAKLWTTGRVCSGKQQSRAAKRRSGAEKSHTRRVFSRSAQSVMTMTCPGKTADAVSRPRAPLWHGPSSPPGSPQGPSRCFQEVHQEGLEGNSPSCYSPLSLRICSQPTAHISSQGNCDKALSIG